MNTLGYDHPKELSQSIKLCGCIKDGCLLWEEFLDFFFLRNSSLQQRIDGKDNWWRKIGHEADEKENNRP